MAEEGAEGHLTGAFKGSYGKISKCGSERHGEVMLERGLSLRDGLGLGLGDNCLERFWELIWG